MQQSNLYIIIFSVALTVVLGGLLSIAAVGLKPMQTKAIELDTKKQILSSVMELTPETDVIGTYNSRTNSIVVNLEGELIENDKDGNPLIAEKISIEKESKKDPEDMLLPVFLYMNEKDASKVDAYIFPLFGNGLWDKIWGYIAVSPDLTTVKGIAMDHKGETPGLGARITDKEVKDRYKTKKLFDANGNLVGIEMKKGERGDPSLFGEHEVDGMSGATLTGNGVNDMILKYIQFYQAYIDKIKAGETVALN
ncbi:NADH:ubiquinone reductase (Na(+)-transporting) subunit C [Fulvivirgaceae bacterium BMA12]|uniref:Na(+)-translocating NADH-quinone reductase subunit C n=1 Tax=Agaribacillus aureus TaxID=3051825 RepID=A0ABT8L0F6_9BACT|nr:NADH:ubiquinone reductase (Na(+)-transporting) subunit C [Fulvivirgaceae bacterium BMA12]